ncbi:MAG: acyl carrier protein, partial [Myxococcota bacterium]
MNDTSTFDSLIQLASARFRIDLNGTGPDSDMFVTLGIDSYQAMELLTDLEEHFGVEIPDYELRGVSTFGALS